MSRPRRSWDWRDWAQAAADVASGEVHEHQQFELKGENYGNGESAKWDRFEAWFQGECPCDQPDCSEGHWRREFRIPRPRSATVLAV